MKKSLSLKTRLIVGYTGLRTAGILLILLAMQLNVLSQTTIYIDPTNTSTGQNGSITNPYDSWTDFSLVNGNTYLQKRGTTYSSSTQIDISSKSNITVGAYNTGNRPLFSYTGSGYAVRIASSSNCTFGNFEVNGNGNAYSLVGVLGSSGNYTMNITINNCVLYNAHNTSNAGFGIYGSYNSNLSILNTEIHNVALDGIYLANIPNIEIGYCNVYDVNRRYFLNPNQTYSSGDGIQMDGNYNGFHIHHTIVDRTNGAGNKFDLIFNSAAGTSDNATGILEYCTFRTGPNVSTAVHIERGNGIITRYNTFSGSTQGIRLGGAGTSNNTIHNNLFYNCSNGIGVGYSYSVSIAPIGPCTNTKIFNNVFYHVSSKHIWLDQSYVEARNNIHMRTTDAGVAIYNYGGGTWIISNNCYSAAAVSGTPGTGTNPVIGNPNFINPATGNFNIQSNSPVINTGISVGIAFDRDSTAIFQGTSPEIGAYEFISSSGSNLPPVINNQSFSINENTANGTVVGTIVASDPNAGQILLYSITGGNTSSAFAINANTGALTVANTAALNFESTPVFQLTVQVQDNGVGNLTASSTITVNLTNVNENPIISNQNFAVASNSPNGTVVGTVTAADPDLNQTLSYSITAGNTSTAFAINAATGIVTVANSAAVNYLTNPAFNLTIRVQDNGSPVLASFATISITVTPTNTAPVILIQSFAVNENSPLGATVGQVIASDPDPGQALAYTILSGNTGSAFQISTTGLITVASPQMLNFETTQSFILLIQVTDNGVPSIASSTNITITLNNVNESPVISGSQSFTIAENIPAGTQVGVVTGSDPDAGQTLSFSIVGGNTGNAFSVSTSTGLIQVAGNLNYESYSQYSLIIRATDNGSPVLFDEEVVMVNLTDVNENPVITNQALQVISYSPAGTVVGTIAASDPDINQALAYSITAGNTSNAFAINASNGILTVANSAAVNYITNPVFNLTIRVQDNGTPILSSYAAITVTVTSVNSAPVILDQAFSANENIAQGIIIGQVLAGDPDPAQTLSYSITTGNTSGAFQISANGILSVANHGALNFEANPVFQLNILVSDNGLPQLSASASIAVTLIDLNETPAITGNTNFAVNEHVVSGTLAGTITGTDPDAGQALTYSIISGNTNNAFAISAITGAITVAGSISFESCSLYTLTVRVSDNGSPSLWSEVTSMVQLIDVNEQPDIANQGFSYGIFAPNGTVIGIIAASDPDLNQTLIYSITSGNSNGAFALNAADGTLTIANSTALNPEIMATFTLNVLVQDNGNPMLSSSAVVTVSIDDQNASPAINPQAFSTNENRPLGAIVGTVIATDPNPGQALAYTIVSGNSSDAFSISSTGVLSVKSPLAVNFETTPLFTLQVMVSDNGSPVMSAQAQVLITVNDVNDPPVMLPQTYTAFENIPKGRYVCKIIATDQDPGDTYQSYIMAGNTNNAFTLQANTSRMFVNNAAAMNYEANPVFHLTIRSVDNHGAFSEQTVTINLLDVNEAPVIRNQNFAVNVSSPNGTIVGTVVASDPDQGQSLKYAITLGNTYGIFGIDQNTGVLTLVNASALNFSNISVFKLTVKVNDNGSPILYSNGYMTINVIRSKDTESLDITVNPDSGRLNLSLTVYPNPSSDGIFNIKFDEELSEPTTITITDLSGKILAVENPGMGLIQTLNLSSLPSGIYLMHAKSAQKQSVSKLIRQ